MLEKFIQYFKERKQWNTNNHFIAAVSGGIDSVVLCTLCKQAGLNFSIAHCNFQLRGEESERDEQFVRSLAAQYNVGVNVIRFDTATYAEEHKLSIQEAARKLRYSWFLDLRAEKKAAYTLIAHHAHDNIETLLMNFFRGTGLQGLTAMPEWNLTQTYILRPLIGFRRREIEQFARDNNLKWVEDSSNNSLKYTRNYFRNELIPALRSIYPSVEENLLDNIDRFKKINAFYQNAIFEAKEKLLTHNKSEVKIPVKKLLEFQHTSLIYEIIKDYGFGEKQVEEVIKLCHADSGKYIQNDEYQIIKHRNWLIIAPVFVRTDTIAIDKEQKQVRFSGGLLELKSSSVKKVQLDKSPNIAQLDANHIEFPLLLRKWEQGDYFYPLGMPKQKKLARFFIDQKLAKHEKENIWVIESAGRIIWVVGHRIDDRFKLTPNTKEILKINVSSL